MSAAASERRRVDVLLLIVAVVWGSSYLSAKALVVTGGVLTVLALRYLVSAAAMTIVCAARRPPRPGRHEVVVGLTLGATQAAVLTLETYGVSLTSATNAGLLISLTILLTPMLDGLVSRRWLPPRFFAAAAVALAGIVLLVSGSGLRVPSAGDALVLSAAVVRAVHVTASSRLTRARPHAPAMDTVSITLLQTIVGAAVCTPAAAPALARTVAGFGPEQWLGVLYLALGCSVFAFLVQLGAVRRTSASRASLLLGTEPLWAVLIGLTIAGEALSPAGAVGGALVVAGTIWGQQIEARHRAHLPAPAGAACGPSVTTRKLQPTDLTDSPGGPMTNPNAPGTTAGPDVTPAEHPLYERLLAALDTVGASYRLLEHPSEGRTELVSAMRGHPVAHAAKCLVVMIKIGKKQTRYVLAVVPGDARLDLNAVKALFGGTYVSFASTDKAEELAGSVSGTVLPISYDERLELIADPALLEAPQLFFNAARLDRSLAIRTTDWVNFARPRLADITSH